MNPFVHKTQYLFNLISILGIYPVATLILYNRIQGFLPEMSGTFQIC